MSFRVLLVALATTLVLAPSASSTAPMRAVPGIGVVRLGDSWSIGAANLPRSSYVIIAPGYAGIASSIRARSPRTRVLAYKSSMDVDADAGCAAHPIPCETGLSYAAAMAHDQSAPKDPWLLRDASGQPIPETYPGKYVGDVGSPGYQQRWIRNVLTCLAVKKASGVFIDNVLGDVAGLTNGRYPAKYPTAAAWSDAMASFVARVGAALHAKGYFVAVNAYMPYPNDTVWWKRIAPSTDALTDEYFQQNPNDPHQLYTSDAPTWMGHWDYWQQLIDIAQNAGSSFFGIQYGNIDDTGLMQYGRASFLLEWDGRDGAFMFSPLTATDPWAKAWTTDVGEPLGNRFRVGNGWRRNFTRATVVVDPSASKPQTFELGGTYTTTDGRSVTSITLTPTSAAILTRTAPARPARGGLTWDGKRYTTRRAFNRWLKAHHTSWKAWARRYPAAARRLSGG